MESLRKIPNHSLYSVTPEGRVFTYRNRKGWITGATDKLGYKRLHATNDAGDRSNLYVHRAVAMAFIPNPLNKPHINHKDSNPSNNHVDNLEWCTHAENMQHSAARGRKPGFKGEDNGHHKYSAELVRLVRRLYASGEYTQMDLKRKFGIPQPTVSVIVRRAQWGHI